MLPVSFTFANDPHSIYRKEFRVGGKMIGLSDIKTFAVIGGDKRQLFLADLLLKDGYGVVMGGFDKLVSTGGVKLTDVPSAVSCADAVIFALPSVRADGSLNTPFNSGKLYLSEHDQNVLVRKPVFAAFADKLLRFYPGLKKGSVYDYASRNDFAILNAVPTAEGAVERAMSEYEGTVADSRVMVVGFGRIGRALARLLKAMNARVTVCARSPRDFAEIKTLGYRCLNTTRLSEITKTDIVFNTVPALIFDRKLLSRTDPETLIIDLSSLPGGVDFEAADNFGISALRALSLPGKCSPKTAGGIIKDTVINILS